MTFLYGVNCVAIGIFVVRPFSRVLRDWFSRHVVCFHSSIFRSSFPLERVTFMFYFVIDDTF
jgi:hypothetical protein